MARIGGSDDNGGQFEVVMLDGMMSAFVAWLDSKNLDLVKGPEVEAGEIPWYIIGVRPDLLRVADGIENWKPTGIRKPT